jgi:hypothetical protein
LLTWRRVFERAGPFNMELRVGELLDWTDRARSVGLVLEALPVAVMRRRRHETNLTAGGDYRLLMIEAVRHALHQRRRPTGTPPASSPGSAP